MSTDLIRVLFMGDNHCDDAQPPARHDNYLQACISELHETLELGKSKNVDAIILLGDVFNRMEVGALCRNLVLETLQSDAQGQPWPFRKIVVVGNHDVKHNMHNLDSSALGTLFKAGVIEIQDSYPELGLGIAHFSSDIEEKITQGLLTQDQNVVWAVHGSIVTKPIYGPHVFFKDIKLNPECKLVVAGHVHNAIQEKRGDGVVFVNPGNVGRYVASKENMERQIKVLYAEWALDGSQVKLKYIPLKSALPGNQVFKMEQIQAVKAQAAQAKKFMQATQQMTAFVQLEDKYESLEKSGKAKGILDEVVKLAIETLKEVNGEK